MILGARPITRRRFAAGTRNSSGEFVSGAMTPSTIYASVQPATVEDQQTLPEAERHRSTIRLYTVFADTLRTTSQYTEVQADHVVIAIGDAQLDGTYQVRTVDSENAILPHYRVLAVALQEGV
jgi:hypothetical protein